MSIKHYGKNFIVGHSCDDRLSKEEVIKKYNIFSSGMRQYSKIKDDLIELNKLDQNKKYTVCKRQYTGHVGIPEITEGLIDRIFISDAIFWPGKMCNFG